MKTKWNWSTITFHSPYDLAINHIKCNSHKFVEHFRLMAEGAIYTKKNSKRAKLHADEVQQHILSIEDAHHFFTMTYQSTLTQEQRTLDNLEWDLESVYQWLLVAIFGMALTYCHGFISVLGLFGSILALIAISIPSIVSSKKRFVSYLISIAGAVFQFGEQAEIQDRDAV